MPTYDYLCQDCGHRFEMFQAITDKALESCPLCGGRVKRLISGGAGLIFKGSGFYITDYKKKTGEKTDSSGSADTSKDKKKEKKQKPANETGASAEK